MSSATATEKESIGKAIGRIATGVYVATVQEDGEPNGILLSWLVQAGFEPPAVTFAVNKGRPILPLMTEGHGVTINVLAEGNNEIFKRFAAPGKPGQKRFEGLKLEAEATASSPVFSEAVAYMDCRIAKILETDGDHVLVIANIVAGNLLHEGAKPMVHLRKSGFNY